MTAASPIPAHCPACDTPLISTARQVVSVAVLVSGGTLVAGEIKSLNPERVSLAGTRLTCPNCSFTADANAYLAAYLALAKTGGPP